MSGPVVMRQFQLSMLLTSLCVAEKLTIFHALKYILSLPIVICSHLELLSKSVGYLRKKTMSCRHTVHKFGILELCWKHLVIIWPIRL